MPLLPVTSERVQAAATRLAAGGWHFTGRQLYYQVCRDVEVARPKIAPVEVGFGGVLVLGGLITGHRLSFAIVGGLGLILIAVGAVTHLVERRPEPEGRALAMSLFAFGSEYLNGRSYPGLVDDEVQRPAREGAPTMLICDRAETAALLAANADQLGQPVAITDASALDNVRGARRVVALHDSDPAGCALVAGVRERGVAVADAGLNPRDAIGRRTQLIEGAPARLPRDLSGHLTAEEVQWLISGRRLELATLTPEEIVLRVRAALS